MKKLICIILCLMIYSSLVSCQNDIPQTTITPESTPESEVIEYTIYRDNSGVAAEGEVVDNIGESKDLWFEDVAKLNIDVSSKPIIDENVPQTKTIIFRGEELNLKYWKTTDYPTQFNLTNEEVINSKVNYKTLDKYNITEGKKTATFEFNRETQQIEYFYLHYVDNPDYGTFTIKEAIKKSKEYIVSLYGDEHIDEYKIVEADYYGLSNHEKDMIRVVFDREINGVLSLNETLKFCFNLDGEMVAANTKTYGIMDNLVADITEEKLKAAEEKLISMFPEDAFIQNEKYITLDMATGICYLEMFIEGDVYFINIT